MLRGRFKNQSQVFWPPSQCTSSSIRDVLKVSEDFPESEWYPNWCSHGKCHPILSLDSSGQVPLSWVTSMLVGCFPVPSIGGGQPWTGTRRRLLERLLLSLDPDFHQDPHIQKHHPSWPFITWSPQVAKPLPPEKQAILLRPCSVFWWKVTLAEDFPSVCTINTDVHVSLEYSLPSFALHRGWDLSSLRHRGPCSGWKFLTSLADLWSEMGYLFPFILSVFMFPLVPNS